MSRLLERAAVFETKEQEPLTQLSGTSFRASTSDTYYVVEETYVVAIGLAACSVFFPSGPGLCNGLHTYESTCSVVFPCSHSDGNTYISVAPGIFQWVVGKGLSPVHILHSSRNEGGL